MNWLVAGQHQKKESFSVLKSILLDKEAAANAAADHKKGEERRVGKGCSGHLMRLLHLLLLLLLKGQRKEGRPLPFVHNIMPMINIPRSSAVCLRVSKMNCWAVCLEQRTTTVR